MNFVESSYRPIVLLIIESGAVYSFTLMTLLILYKQHSWFQYVLLDAVRPLHALPAVFRVTYRVIIPQISCIVGLVFSMIILRIGLGMMSVSGESKRARDYSSFRATTQSHAEKAEKGAHVTLQLGQASSLGDTSDSHSMAAPPMTFKDPSDV